MFLVFCVYIIWKIMIEGYQMSHSSGTFKAYILLGTNQIDLLSIIFNSLAIALHKTESTSLTLVR